MRKLLLLPLLTFWIWSVAPAGANSVPTIALDCDSVDVAWTSFPERPIDLTVTLVQHGRTYTRVVSTEGARDGETVIPANFSDGPATAEVAWTLQKEHHAGPVETVLHCTTTTTSLLPVTTELVGTSTTTTPGLPDTGSGASLWALGAGAYLVALGAVFMALNRRGTR